MTQQVQRVLKHSRELVLSRGLQVAESESGERWLSILKQREGTACVMDKERAPVIQAEGAARS